MTRKRHILTLLALPLLVACGTHRFTHTGQQQVIRSTIVTPPLMTTGGEQTLRREAPHLINNVRAYEPSTWQGALQTRLDALCCDTLLRSTQLGLCVYDLTDGVMLYSVNADQRMRPASNQKIVTAVAALDQLPAEHRYTPVVRTPGRGWCWDDEETGMTDFKAGGKRKSSSCLWAEDREWSLHDVLQPMMKKSDNMMAESVFWELGTGNDKPAKAAAKRVEEVIRKAGLNPQDYDIVDGSGLSLYNYVTPRLLLTLLCYAHSQPAIYNELYAAMPIAGVDGTLAKRMEGTTAQGNVHAKTGTVTGVSTLSGYCKATNGHLLCFSIMNQGLTRAALGRAFQDRICSALTE
ncbi:MAG: D-alanyl-D-alanine carboxypeptidase/D-alanyl-D-alanine-endopeptidase [Bacteroidales bacterium]|nr:D-alanyl-D-alanine carboxypeptidase/D-alanyl-D-alanine-endopeptidase [Candidatus Physcousia equi]